MKLIEHLLQLDCSSRNATFIREALIARGITPSIGQVRQALKSLLTTESSSTQTLTCPICPRNKATSDTHDQIYHNDLIAALNSLRISINDVPIPFHCYCENPTPHDTNACEQARIAEQDYGLTPKYHCIICKKFGEDLYADPQGRVWIDGITVCELNRQIAQRENNQHIRMREEMTAAAFSRFQPIHCL